MVGCDDGGQFAVPSALIDVVAVDTFDCELGADDDDDCEPFEIAAVAVDDVVVDEDDDVVATAAAVVVVVAGVVVAADSDELDSNDVNIDSASCHLDNSRQHCASKYFALGSFRQRSFSM